MSADDMRTARGLESMGTDTVVALRTSDSPSRRSSRPGIRPAAVDELVTASHERASLVVAAGSYLDDEREGHGGGGPNRRERKEAVRRILCSHPEWADRRIGEFCGVSPKTVADLRRQLLDIYGEGELDRVDVRVGRDGRARPVDPAGQRARIAAALEQRPDASLRSIAKTVGVSPETVRRVRALLREPGGLPEAVPRTADVVTLPPLPRSKPRAPHWKADVALTSREGGSATVAFLEQTDVHEEDLECHATSIPLSRVYEIADEARRRASFWAKLADRVEARAKRSG